MTNGSRTTSWTLLTLGLICGVVATSSAAQRAHTRRATTPASSQQVLETLRQRGDLSGQRRHVWNVFAQITGATADSDRAPFASWYGQAEVFSTRGAEVLGDGAIAQPLARSELSQMLPPADAGHANTSLSIQSAGAPIINFTLYNDAACEHIRRHRLYLRPELEKLQRAGPEDEFIARNRSVPDFPADAMVMKTAWWPVARDRPTPLPVWDASQNPPRRGGNDFLSWKRIAVIDPNSPRTSLDHASSDNETFEFAGRRRTVSRRVGLDAFFRIVINGDMARQLTEDPIASKAALLVLGRPFEHGDLLILVAAHIATKEIQEWVWGTLWWHDQAGSGPFAADRPASMQSPWQNYQLQVAFDAQRPLAADGGPHVAFNPWLEGRFPDSGNGGGTMSNCQACHRRASFPSVDFLPVTRGRPELQHDPAYAPHRLRTNFIWAIALHAQP